ncbi:MAG: 3-hydroxybutyryl-CoA dehydrogenase [Bacteroidia bacterium]|nr:3-hydroxybutyryl-CoA dehydrogenase [Bacteroidia bacterium]
MVIGVIGSGAMGSGIAQVAAQNGCVTKVFDLDTKQLEKAEKAIISGLQKLVDKAKITQATMQATVSNLEFCTTLEQLSDCELVIEAIVEIKEIKKALFSDLEKVVSSNCILATNTSSLSIASLSSSLQSSERFIGIHFFNPATIMPLVEVIPGLMTSQESIEFSVQLIKSWGKSVVLTKDTPGFIVNRVARSYYSESIRIAEEQIADYATIDWSLKTFGGFKMGPFELMDFIGNDINYRVTESVWTQFFYEPRFKPSITQQRLFESGFFGVKTGRGYYSYGEQESKPVPKEDVELGKEIFMRVISMLINEAVEAYYLGIASPGDLDLAIQKGVNYPKGLLKWGEEIGWEKVLSNLQFLFDEYGEDRYRPSILLKKLAKGNKNIHW